MIRSGEVHLGNRIAEWAERSRWEWIPGHEPTGNAPLRGLVVDPEDSIRGVVSVTPLEGRLGPTYFVETYRGNLILGESWGDEESLGVVLDDALRLIQGPKSPEETAAWRLAAES